MTDVLRIRVGQPQASLPDAGLVILEQGPQVTVEGPRRPSVIVSPDGTRRFRVGPGQPGTHAGRFLDVTWHADGTCELEPDQFGRRELYIQADPGGTVLATSLDLLPVSATGDTFDQLALAHALAVYGSRPPKRHTYYGSVRRLGIGESVRIANGHVEIRQARFEPVSAGPFGERQLHEYADRLLDAVRRDGSPDGNVVYLSSGWDSTCLLACLVHVFGARAVRAVTGRMRYSERAGVINQFEIDRARAMADYYGIPLDIVEFDYRSTGAMETAAQWGPLFRAHQFGSAVGYNHGLLAAEARRVARDAPVFAGEISDGAHNLGFSQYVTVFHPDLAFREYSDKMASYLFGPTFLGLLKSGHFTQDAVYQFLKGRLGPVAFDTPAAPDAMVRQQLSSFFLRPQRFPLWSLQNVRMLTPEGRDAYQSHMESQYLAEAGERCTPDTLYGWFLHLYNSFHWQGSTVAPLAVTAEAMGLRAELPFWDSEVQRLLSAMPEDGGRGLDLNHTKHPLKWMLRHRVDYPYHLQKGPHSYLYDVDPGFSHAAEWMYASGFTSYFRTLLAPRPYRDILSPEVFDLAYLDSIVSSFLDGREARGGELSDLLSLASLFTVGFYGHESARTPA